MDYTNVEADLDEVAKEETRQYELILNYIRGKEYHSKPDCNPKSKMKYFFVLGPEEHADV